MMEMLGTLEQGYLRPKPIFPESILGHLFMRKYGMNREQRAQIIRATNGSSRFKDIERLVRASDIEEHRYDDPRGTKHRRETYAVSTSPQQQQQQVLAVHQDDDSSSIVDLDADSSSSDEQILAAEEVDDTDNEELHEILELKQKAKEKFRKSYKNYKETKKKVKEIKKSRQPYYPVVALNQPESGNATGST